MSKTLVYVGTYTRHDPNLPSVNGKGIYVYSLDTDSGALTFLSVMEGIDSPSYLAIDHKKRHLYAVSEISGWDECLVSAYAIDPDSGALSYINKQVTPGGLSCYVSVDQTDRYALVADYWSGKGAAVFPIRDDGGLAPFSSAVEHHGTGPNAERQERPHAHAALTDPTNQYVIVPDLGIDKVMIYRLDHEHGQLIPNASLDLPPGTGPRHFVFHPNGKFAYLIGELKETITALAYDSTHGALEILQTVPTLPADSKKFESSADLHITANGKFLYGSNRGHDSIVIYAVDDQTGKLTYVGHQATGGKTPRNFALDPTETLLLVANQDSDTIVTFRRDPQTGLLHETGQVAAVPTPVCIKML